MTTMRPRLLERFDRSIDRGGREALLNSIVANCHELLNSRREFSLSAPQMGMPSRIDLVRLCPDDAGTVRRMIEDNLRAYEPRLEIAGIDIIEQGESRDKQQLFVLRASLAGPHPEPLRLLLSLNTQGLFTVKVMD